MYIDKGIRFHFEFHLFLSSFVAAANFEQNVQNVFLDKDTLPLLKFDLRNHPPYESLLIFVTLQPNTNPSNTDSMPEL